MLVLSRKESERIRVGDSIVVTVVRLTKDRVRLGIEAPNDVLVLRDELEKDGEETIPVKNREPLRRSIPVQTTIAAKRRARNTEFAPKDSCVAVLEQEEPRGLEEMELDANQERPCPPRKYFRWVDKN